MLRSDLRRALPLLILLVAVVSSAWAQVPAGGTFTVNTNTTDAHFTPRIAGDRGEGFVVVWRHRGPALEQEVLAQRFDAGGAPVGGNFQLNTNTASGSLPAVATDKHGALAAVWDDYWGFSGRLFDTGSSPIGAEFQVTTYTTGIEDMAQVFRRADGPFVVTWHGEGAYGFANEVFARRFEATGSPIGQEFVVNAETHNGQGSPAIGGDVTGRFVVVWADGSQMPSANSRIVGQRFGPSGERIGGEFPVSTGSLVPSGEPAIAVRPSGEFVVSWTKGSPSTDLRARWFDASGVPMASEIGVAFQGIGSIHTIPKAIGTDDLGNFVVVWTSDDGVHRGTRFDAAGQRRGAIFTIATDGSPFDPPAVHTDSVGNFVVAWNAFGVPTVTSIAARRYGGLLPSALETDLAGNGLLEPGESVPLRPSWRSTNASPLTFGASLSGIVGPPGLNYSIRDPTADYGSLAPGATTPCTDCYTIAVSGAGLRPQLHVDATAIETITPDALGQQKRWVIHVGDSFADVPPTHPSYGFVETMLHHGATVGCRGGDASLFCPDGLLTRGQVAPLILIAKEGQAYLPQACTAAPLFDDVPASHPFCRWVEELARRGVVTGCARRQYCPNLTMTRGEIALFLVRMLDPAIVPAACAPPNLYPDVPETHPLCPWIEELAAHGVVMDCGGGNFCPDAELKRGAMAEFVTRAFALTLYGV